MEEEFHKSRGDKMKKVIVSLALVLLIPILWGCSDSVVNPISENPTANNQKGWITLPKNPGMRVEDDYSASKVIDGNMGGEVQLNVDYKATSSLHIKIAAKIKVPKGAYSGEKNVTMIINNTDGTASFYPSPETFNKPLIFDLEILGIDLTGVNPKTLDFAFIASDGSFESVDCHKIEAKIKEGKLKVDDAEIPHFSKYGWCR